jgi:hypothetical protein
MGIKLSFEIDINGETDPRLASLVTELIALAIKKDGPEETVPVIAAPTKKVTMPPPRRRRPPQRPKLAGTHAQRWAAFLSRAPQRTKEFVALLENAYPEFVNQKTAMSALAIAAPRAIGGLTGSMRRWAVADGIELPWSATKIDGARAWIWRGFSDEGDLLEPPASFAEYDKTNQPPSTYDEFFERLPERSQRFLNYLESVGKATVTDAMGALGIDSPKALGGLAGSLNRWGRVAGLPVPFIPIRIDDKKAYQWVGVDSENSSPKAEASEASASDALIDSTMRSVRFLVSRLPDRPGRFLMALGQEGPMEMNRVLSQLGLAKAHALGDMLKTIQSVCEANEVEMPIVEDSTPLGGRTFMLRGWPVEAPVHPTEPLPIPNVSPGAAPGVRVRRRRA